MPEQCTNVAINLNTDTATTEIFDYPESPNGLPHSDIPDTTPDKPPIIIDYNDHDTFITARDGTLEGLRLYNETMVRVFTKRGSLVRTIRDPDTDEYIIDKLAPESLNGIMMEAAKYCTVKHLPKGKTSVSFGMPLPRHVKDILTLGSWPGLGELRKIVPTPRYMSDKTLLKTPGYYKEYGILLRPPVGFKIPTIPDDPQEKVIKWVLDTIFKDLYYDFPFERLSKCSLIDERNDDTLFYHNPSRCHILSYMSLPFLIEIIGAATPLHDSEAPESGTGKSRVMKLASVPSTGKLITPETPPHTYKGDDSKWDAKILTALKAGSEYVLFDNLNTHLSSESLCAVITSHRYQPRLMHTNDIGAYNNLTAWGTSTNNGSFSYDIKRRSVLIRQDAFMADPCSRDNGKYKHPFIDNWAISAWRKLLLACLILCQAWIKAGAKRETNTIGVVLDHPEWFGVMGGLLKTIGMKGFCENLIGITVPDSSKWIQLVRALVKKAPIKSGVPDTGPIVVDTIYQTIMGDASLKIEFSDLGKAELNTDHKKKQLRKRLLEQRDKVFSVPEYGPDKKIIGVDDYKLHVNTEGWYRIVLELVSEPRQTADPQPGPAQSGPVVEE